MKKSEIKFCNSELSKFKPNVSNIYSSYKPSKNKNEFVPIYKSNYTK